MPLITGGGVGGIEGGGTIPYLFKFDWPVNLPAPISTPYTENTFQLARSSFPNAAISGNRLVIAAEAGSFSLTPSIARVAGRAVMWMGKRTGGAIRRGGR